MNYEVKEVIEKRNIEKDITGMIVDSVNQLYKNFEEGFNSLGVLVEYEGQTTTLEASFDGTIWDAIMYAETTMFELFYKTFNHNDGQRADTRRMRNISLFKVALGKKDNNKIE